MEIIAKNLTFSKLCKRTKTELIICHHRAGLGDVFSIHRQHKLRGWAGIGYHYYIRQNGKIYAGRPQYAIGAHCDGKNSISLGVCFEGNLEITTLTKEQIKSGTELLVYLKGLFPKAKIARHKDFDKTLCPGKNFDKGIDITKI